MGIKQINLKLLLYCGFVFENNPYIALYFPPCINVGKSSHDDAMVSNECQEASPYVEIHQLVM
jgi:hypothetical protein